MWFDATRLRFWAPLRPQTTDLTVGATGKVVDTARFASESGDDAQMSAYPIGSVFTAAQAKAWFDTEDAKTSLLILKSLTFNK